MIDTTTGDPADSERAATRLALVGVEFVDATVGGSSAQARTGEAIVMAGGSDGAFQRALPVLEAISKRVFHAGGVGAGARMKLVFNLVLGLNRAVLAEGLEFARAYGLDPERALEVLKAGPAYSTVMDIKGRMMLEGAFDPPQARLSQHLKDVRLILSEGERIGARLPLSGLHAGLLGEVEAAGFGGEDNSAVIRAFGALKKKFQEG